MPDISLKAGEEIEGKREMFKTLVRNVDYSDVYNW